LKNVLASVRKNAWYWRALQGNGIYRDNGKPKRMQVAEVRDEFEWISPVEIDQSHWNRAGYAALFRVDNVIVIIAKIHVAAMLDLEFIEVVLGPAKDLKYYRCKLFEGCLVGDLKVPIPIGKYEFWISRILASVLYAEFEDV